MEKPFEKGDRVRLRYWPKVTGTVEGPCDSTPMPSALVRVDADFMDMDAGETAPIALDELEHI